jgi:hypothetical protein
LCIERALRNGCRRDVGHCEFPVLARPGGLPEAFQTISS